jgi:hypothetical protein
VADDTTASKASGGASASKGVYGTAGPTSPSDPSGAASEYGAKPTTHSGWGAMRDAVNRSLVNALLAAQAA